MAATLLHLWRKNLLEPFKFGGRRKELPKSFSFFWLSIFYFAVLAQLEDFTEETHKVRSAYIYINYLYLLRGWYPLVLISSFLDHYQPLAHSFRTLFRKKLLIKNFVETVGCIDSGNVTRTLYLFFTFFSFCLVEGEDGNWEKQWIKKISKWSRAVSGLSKICWHVNY